jgi:hypothetical protein
LTVWLPSSDQMDFDLAVHHERGFVVRQVNQGDDLRRALENRSGSGRNDLLVGLLLFAISKRFERVTSSSMICTPPTVVLQRSNLVS